MDNEIIQYFKENKIAIEFNSKEHYSKIAKLFQRNDIHGFSVGIMSFYQSKSKFDRIFVKVNLIENKFFTYLIIFLKVSK
jgi:histidinol phosphatase-like PHP family hydrolase